MGCNAMENVKLTPKDIVNKHFKPKMRGYDPNDVDDNRFLLTMSDGNYVYVNISTFYKLNKYVSIRESLPDKNGILYLDYGNNFEIIE